MKFENFLESLHRLFVKSIVQIIFFSQSIRSSIVSIILLLLPILLFVRRYSLLFHNVIFHFILFHYSFPVYFYFLSNGFIVARFYQRPFSKRNEIKKNAIAWRVNDDRQNIGGQQGLSLFPFHFYFFVPPLFFGFSPLVSTPLPRSLSTCFSWTRAFCFFFFLSLSFFFLFFFN